MEKEEDINYTAYADLLKPTESQEQLTQKVKTAFQAPEAEWKQHFQAMTLLRGLNKYQPEVYITDLFPQVLKNIITNVDGLRSKLTKQALTLLFETVKYNKLDTVAQNTLNLLVESLFKISNSEKKFIKDEARAAIIQLQNTNNPGIYFELATITLNNNYSISELAISQLKKKLEKEMITRQNANFKDFLKLVIGNLNAGRAVLQKTAKQIILLLKKSFTEKVFKEQIIAGAGLSPQQQKLIDAALVQKQVKQKASFKDFIKNKKESKDSNQ